MAAFVLYSLTSILLCVANNFTHKIFKEVKFLFCKKTYMILKYLLMFICNQNDLCCHCCCQDASSAVEVG